MRDRDDDTRSRPARRRRPGRARPGWPAVLAGIALMAAACSGGSPATAGPQTPYQKSLAYAQCLRSHGEPSWPDPQSDGSFNVNVDLGSPQYQSANNACAHLEGGQATGAQQQKALSATLAYAACMRSHGITNFPDPTVRGGTISLGFGPTSGIDPNLPQFQSASQACQPRAPRGGS